jgi:hypothetical protein
MLLRALTGFGCAGLFEATESWLNAKASPATRGTVFAIYMVATYATFAGSQFVLNLASPTDFTLFGPGRDPAMLGSRGGRDDPERSAALRPGRPHKGR